MLDSLKRALRHGLALPEEAPTAEEAQLISGIASRAGHFALPLLVMAESLRPLACVMAQAYSGLEPMLELFVAKSAVQRFGALLSKRSNLEQLTKALENKL